ncbi:MAG: aminotransferase class I/II-fold pyridoxal phosphate-dependent enzyme [Akkermansia sp.]
MQAVILAAGMGRRLGELTKHNTKCMLKVNGITLIERLLHQLEALPPRHRLRRIVIVVGYEGQKLRDYIATLDVGIPLVFVDNPIYATTNNIYSLYLAKDYLIQDDTLLFESDLIFEDGIITTLLDNPYPSLALVAKFENWMDGTVVTLDEEDNIKRFIPGSKFRHEESEEYYKTVNIYKFSRLFSETHYVPFLTAYSKALGYNEYYEQVLRVITLLDQPEIKALRLGNESWYEIDDVQDLDIAASIFCDFRERYKRLTQRYGGFWRYPGLLDYCYLVNPYFPDARLMSELKSAVDDLIRSYPSGLRVNNLLAGKYLNIAEEYVCVGNGAAELINVLMGCLEGQVGVIYPTFEEYPNRLPAERLVPYDTAEREYAYDADGLMRYYGSHPVRSMVLINPDNPSGNFIPLADLLRLAAWAEQRSIRLIVDESFVDFSEGGGSNTMITQRILTAHPHLVVLKSISKSYGVPGLRLGVLATADCELMARIRAGVSIWNINSLAEFYLQLFGKYEASYQRACARFRAERERFRARLEEVPYLKAYPSQANYFLCRLSPPYRAEELACTLLQRNILIKNAGSKHGMGEGEYIRLAVRNTSDNDRLVQALLDIAAQRGDSDGI